MCHTRGFSSYLVDLSQLKNWNDLNIDEHGFVNYSWNRWSHRLFIGKNEQGQWCKLGRDINGQGLQWEYKVYQKGWIHPNDNNFRRSVCTLIDKNGHIVPTFAYIHYKSDNDPYNIVNTLPHGNTIHNDLPYEQVRASTCDELATASSVSSSLSECVHIATEKVGGHKAYATAIPRNLPQANYIKGKNPLARKAGSSGGRKGQNSYPEVQRIKSVANSFIKTEVRDSPKGLKDKEHIHWILTQDRMSRLMTDFCLEDGLSVLFIDMTYKTMLDFYLTTVLTRHPYVVHRDSGQRILVPVMFLISNYKDQNAYKVLADALEKHGKLKGVKLRGWCT